MSDPRSAIEKARRIVVKIGSSTLARDAGAYGRLASAVRALSDAGKQVVIVSSGAIALGTMAGGQRIIKTMGSKIIRITPIQGFAAETAGALTILGASHFGVPVSTTHVINACIMGVGASKRISAVRWGVAGNIMTAWVLTLPLSAGMAYAVMSLIDKLF